MNVKLISVTEDCFSEQDRKTPEQLIVYIARVSNPSNQHNDATADKLIKYLIENKHWSPFEMVDMTVEIETSRAIAQQILRHRSFSFQEFSQRYAKVTALEDIQLRKQADKNRQSSTVKLDPDAEDYWIGEINKHLNKSNELYNHLTEIGVAKECARMVLPLTTQTRIYMKGSVRNWIHYLQIRMGEHTQLEHRQIALQIWDIFARLFPSIANVLTR